MAVNGALMTNFPSECVIIGGGPSINAEIMSLEHRIKDKFVILTNYSYKFFTGTLSAFIDRDFYKSRNTEEHPDIYEELRLLPLIVGIDINGISEFKLPNTILLNRNSENVYEKSLKKGFYTKNLTGIFSISLASFLMNYTGNLFLLGFDWSRRPPNEVDLKNYNPVCNFDLHYYGKNIKHEGNNKIGYYERHLPDREFEPFMKQKTKIYNVSLNSNINIFEKISYEHMFNLLNNETYNQDELRTKIKEKLCIL
jgi:hypothetical protein